MLLDITCECEGNLQALLVLQKGICSFQQQNGLLG